MPYLLDSNIVSALSKRPYGSVAFHLDRVGSGNGATSVIVAAELQFGLHENFDPERSRRVTGVLSRLPVLPWEPPADQVYGELRARLEKAGTPIGTVDTFIAAHALALDCVLVTDNEREFGRVPGLRVENWLRD